jgi:flotillin
MPTAVPMLALSPTIIATIVLPVLLFLFFFALMVKQYKRCPSNRILVVYGRVGGEQTSRCIHGGGAFVVPLVQDFQYLSLKPMTIDIQLTDALSLQNIRVNVPSTFTVGISTDQAIMQNAAERLLGMREQEIATQAQDIILGQMRLVIATLSIEEINQDREKFLTLVNHNVKAELNKIGLEVINVNIRDITDDSGYIQAIGRKAAAEAVNKARVEVAEANKSGAIGEAQANREKEVVVAQQHAQSAVGQKEAERNQRVSVSKLEAEGVSGEAAAQREQEIAIAEQRALTEQGRKNAEAAQRVRVAELEARAVEGENTSRANIAAFNATLAERAAEARRRGETASATALRDVLKAEAESELAKLQKEQIVHQNIERQKIEIDAEAEAEKRRRIARGDADAVLAKYNAEAEGVRAVLDAKAEGYRRLIESCAARPELAPTLLVIEKLPQLIAEQVKAIQNLKIDKITVWDGGTGNGDGPGGTANFLRGLISALPPMHDLAKQAGVQLPDILGTVKDEPATGAASGPVSAKPPRPSA